MKTLEIRVHPWTKPSNAFTFPSHNDCLLEPLNVRDVISIMVHSFLFFSCDKINLTKTVSHPKHADGDNNKQNQEMDRRCLYSVAMIQYQPIIIIGLLMFTVFIGQHYTPMGVYYRKPS
jgi:hypothetical protein